MDHACSRGRNFVPIRAISDGQSDLPTYVVKRGSNYFPYNIHLDPRVFQPNIHLLEHLQSYFRNPRVQTLHFRILRFILLYSYKFLSLIHRKGGGAKTKYACTLTRIITRTLYIKSVPAFNLGKHAICPR